MNPERLGTEAIERCINAAALKFKGAKECAPLLADVEAARAELAALITERDTAAQSACAKAYAEGFQDALRRAANRIGWSEEAMTNKRAMAIVQATPIAGRPESPYLTEALASPAPSGGQAADRLKMLTEIRRVFGLGRETFLNWLDKREAAEMESRGQGTTNRPGDPWGTALASPAPVTQVIASNPADGVNTYVGGKLNSSVAPTSPSEAVDSAAKYEICVQLQAEVEELKQLVNRVGQGRHHARMFGKLGVCDKSAGFESCADPLCETARKAASGQPPVGPDLCDRDAACILAKDHDGECEFG